MLIIRNLIFFFLAFTLTVAVLWYGERFMGDTRIIKTPKEVRPDKIIKIPEDAGPEVSKSVPLSIIKREVVSPPPLRSFRTESEKTSESLITPSGVLSLTNINRAANHLKPLRENAKLNSVAELKVKDMFSKQYFAHVSPQGEDAGDLAEKVNYQFIRIGENLASGNFMNDQELIQGWMNSPGHRENILNTAYEEIGIAVKRGTFEGKNVWMAVQTFGLPRSACPLPNEELKQKIEEYDKTFAELRSNLDTLRAEIEGMQNISPERYNKLVESYNILAERYNKLAEEIKSLIEAYNASVEATNRCIEEKTHR
jgi:uncharacterized protein YkwD